MLILNQTILTDKQLGVLFSETVQTAIFSKSYWIIAAACAIIWFMGSIPAFQDSDIMGLFRGMAKFAFLSMILFYFIVVHWM